MDLLTHVVFVAALQFSRLLEPAMGPMEEFDLSMRQKLAMIHVPFEWQGTVVTIACGLLLFLVFRALQGTARIIFALSVAVLLAKIYGVLPPP